MFLGLVTSVIEFTNLFYCPFGFSDGNKKGMGNNPMSFCCYMILFQAISYLMPSFFAICLGRASL